jgi:hypothetical protein
MYMVRVITKNPEHLLTAIRDRIADGSVTTWRLTDQGYFTHTRANLKNLAWFKPTISSGKELSLNILRPKGGNISKEAYAIYHSRFSEMLLRHFDGDLSGILVTSLASQGDLV